MRRTRKRANSSSGRPGSGLGWFVLGFLFACAAAGALWMYRHHDRGGQAKAVRVASGRMAAPGAVAAQGAVAAPAGRAAAPGGARAVPEPPFGISEDVFEAGAQTYAQRCAACHGTPGHDASSRHDAAGGLEMRPRAGQLWRDGATVRRAPGTTFNAVKFGLPHAGASHAFGGRLTDLQIWQVSLLLKHADEPLPDPVVRLLGQP